MSAPPSRPSRARAWLVGALALCAGYAAVGLLALAPRVDDGYRVRYLENRLDGPVLARPAGGPVDAIDFSRADLPPGVATVSGLDEPQSWGAWSDAEPSFPVRIAWSRPISGRVCVWLLAASSPRHVGRAATLRLGDASATFVPRGPPASWQRVELAPGAPADVLELRPALDVRPPHDHMQWTGTERITVATHRLALHRLAVVDGPCAG